MFGVGSSSKKVIAEYDRIIAGLGTEFDVLRKMSVSDISENGFGDLSKLIDRMRKGDIHIEPGYDGVYGVIKIFANDSERKKFSDQISMW
jgi:PHP family Zn ribbon phosphoesterase